jgi:hypothetical protein
MPSEPQLIDVQKIQIDLSNYRIGKQQTWEEGLHAMIEEQGQKLVKLAQHILEHGVNPLKSLAVVPLGDGEYTSVEGNRRVTVLRLLHQPELAKGTSLESQFVRLSKRKELLPKQIRCVVFDSKAEAYLWIRLEHDPPAHDALEFVMAQAVLDDDLNERLAGHDFPVSTLERLLKSENVRTELGLSFWV